MADKYVALAHLDDAEAAIMSHLAAISAAGPEIPDEDLPDPMMMLVAVLRSVGRAAGALESDNGPELGIQRDGSGKVVAITYEGDTYHQAF